MSYDSYGQGIYLENFKYLAKQVAQSAPYIHSRRFLFQDGLSQTPLFMKVGINYSLVHFILEPGKLTERHLLKRQVNYTLFCLAAHSYIVEVAAMLCQRMTPVWYHQMFSNTWKTRRVNRSYIWLSFSHHGRNRIKLRMNGDAFKIILNIMY